MSDTLLTTKLYMPPPRGQLVSRKRLLERLDAIRLPEDGFARALTLVSAPAGYGKTTLVTEWLRSGSTPYCWLSLDEEDNDPVRFLAYLTAALQEVHPEFGETALKLQQSPQPTPEDVVMTALINDIAAIPVPFILALDDFHVIQNPTINHQLQFILEHQPPQMHLVLMTREDPWLPLPRLRARRDMLEIRQDDLRFSPDEAADFLRRVMGIDLSQEEIEVLEQRTEGWIAGLQLAALSMRGAYDVKGFIQAFTGSNRFVLDYLFEEVFQQQPSEVQAFLLCTSVLDKFTAPLCNLLSGRYDSQVQLETLEKANLFIVPLDPSRHWYRYHRLFADLLRHQLRKKGEPSEVSLHQQASQWYWDNQFPAEAVAHALQAKDWDLAASQIQASSDNLLKLGEAATLVSWCARLPEDTFPSKPTLILNYAWALMLTSQFNAAKGVLDQVEQVAGDERAIKGEVAAARAYLAQSLGDIPRMVELSQQALAYLPPENKNSRSLVALNLGIAYWHIGRLDEAQQALDEALPDCQGSGNAYGEVMASLFIARTFAVRGQLHRAGELLEQLTQAHRDMLPNPLVYLDLGTLYYEWNDLDRAGHYLRQALESSRLGGNQEFETGAHLLLARLDLAREDFIGASQELAYAQGLEGSNPLPQRTHNRRLDMEAIIAIRKGELEVARNLVQDLTPGIDAHPFYRFLGLTQARYALARGDKSMASTYLDKSIQIARENDWKYGLIAALTLKALACPSSKQAQDTLVEALTLAQPHGFIRTFVETGPKLIPLLQEAAQQGISPGYVGEILFAFPGKTTPKEKMVVSGDLILETLSEREMEVLRLVAAGLSNRQIARKLVLSLGTVKSHLHNIYGKLEVRNRPQAVNRARELNLL